MFRDFIAYGSWRTGVHVAVGDVTGGGGADIVAGKGSGGTQAFRVYDGPTGNVLYQVIAYDSSFGVGGTRVAIADVNGDRRGDVITSPGPGDRSLVRVWSGTTLIRNFLAFSSTYKGGDFVSAGDLNRDGRAEIVVGAGTGMPLVVKVFDGRTNAVLRNLMPIGTSSQGGVRVAVTDWNRDGRLDLVVTRGPNTPPLVRVVDFASTGLIDEFFSGDQAYRGGLWIAGRAQS